MTKLNLAHGEHPTELPGWVNADLVWDGVRWAGTCAAADAFRLPFADASFEAAYLGHFLEHVWWKDLPALMAELERVLVPGATVMVVGPAIERAVEQGEPDWLVDAVVGAGVGPGAHKWIPTEELHAIALEQAGWTVNVIDVQDARPPEWPNPAHQARWQCAMTATKRGGS